MLPELSLGFSGGSDDKESACNAGDSGLIPGLERSPGEGNSYPTPVVLLGEFHGQRNLAGYSPRSHIESDTTERLTLFHFLPLYILTYINAHCWEFEA